MNELYVPGMYVRCESCGVCLIDRLENVEYPDGVSRRCYVLKPISSPSLEVSVSVENAAQIKPLLTKQEIDRMLSDEICAETITWNAERKLRSSQFRKILAEGDALTLLRLIRCILSQKNLLEAAGKQLSASDDGMCRDAERMLDEEFGFSLGISVDEVGSYIRAHLNPAAV